MAGAPNKVVPRVVSLHQALLQAGCGGRVILRSAAEAQIMRKWGVSPASCRSYIDAGRVLGLWELTTSGPRVAEGLLPLGYRALPGLLILRRESTESFDVPNLA